MEKRIVCVVSLVMGAGLGFLLAKATSKQEIARAGKLNSSTSVVGGLPSAPVGTTEITSQTGSSSGTGRGHLQEVDALLDLVNHFNGGNNLELYKKLEHLGLADVVALAAELENVPATDNRLYQVRNALFNRWAKLDPDAAWIAATNIGNPGHQGAAMSAVLGEIALTDFPKARNLVNSLENGQAKQAAMNGIVGAASVQNPELVFDLVSKVAGQQAAWQLNQLFQRWTRSQPEVAIAKLSEIKGHQRRAQALNGLIAGLAASDPERALTFAQGLENANERKQALNTAVANIAATDPQRALELLIDVPNGSQRKQMIGSIASAWSNQDASAAMKWMQTLTLSERKSAMDSSIWQFAQNDPAAAAELIGSIPMSNSSSHLYQNLAHQWAQFDSEAAAAWVDTLPLGAGRQQAVNGLINAYQREDPAKAADMLSREGVTNNNSHMAGNVFGNWVTIDEEAAIAWLDGMETGSNAIRNVVSSAMHQWAQHDSTGAAEYALGIDDEKMRKLAVSSIMSRWGQSEPMAAKDWALSNLEGDIKTESLSSLIQNIAHNDPNQALELYAETTARLTDEEIDKSFKNVTSSIAQSWSRYDAAGAAEWVMDLPEGDQRSSSIQSVVRNWSEADPVGASEFVGALPKGDERDGAVESLVRNVQQTDPESAFIWAESITDDQKRSSVVHNAAMQWKEIDADAAFQAVGGANIPDEAKVRLLKQLQE